MKLACQEGLIPGDTFAAGLAKLAAYGFEGVELNGARLLDPEGLAERRAALAESPVRPSSICGGFPAELVHPDPKRRRACVDTIKRLIDIAAELGAGGPIVVPIFNANDRIPGLSPLRSRHDLEIDLLCTLLAEIGGHAESVGAVMFLEPLNRYESDALKNVAEAAAVVRRVGSPGIRVIADFFHMNIEETDIPAALTAAGDLIGHIHLADNTRLEPGTGMTDFAAGFAALKQIGYTGYMALECGFSGPADEVLPRSVAYLRRCIAEG
ncbi:MAG: sugar phosphate isomerase/epimerase [Armatimonadetes bacterium]|nr:sugar phosphate isomerase/epimerase [Armatimonadota bacterium]